MIFNSLVLIFMFILPLGHGEKFFSKFVSGKGNVNNQDSNFANVCETVRIMPRIAMAVVGGASVKFENSAPYIAAIGERISNDSVSWFCGGSLISTHHVLTAAHCLVSRNVSTIRFGSFSTKKKSTENDYEVLNTIIHPEYKITESYNDIGIIIVKNRIVFDRTIKPVCLPQSDNYKYEKEYAKVIGWGAKEFGGEGSPKLQQVEVEVFSNLNCEKAYQNSTLAPKSFPKGIKNEQLCAGSKKGGKDACQGDSGGPLVLTDEQGIVRQIGIVSTGAGCGLKMYPGVYTRVSSYSNWIQEQIKNSKRSQSILTEEDSDEKPNRSKVQTSSHYNNKTIGTDDHSQNNKKNYSLQRQTQDPGEIHSQNENISNGRRQSNTIVETNFLINSVSNNKKPNHESREFFQREENRKKYDELVQPTTVKGHPRITSALAKRPVKGQRKFFNQNTSIHKPSMTSSIYRHRINKT